MGVITSGLFLNIADRISAQADTLTTAFASARATGGGTRYTRIHEGVPVAGDFDVENDLISSAHTLDSNIQNSPLLSNIFGAVIVADQRHVQRFGNTTLDTYLSGNAIRVGDGYAHAYGASIGTELLASDVMAPTQSLASLAFTASGTATLNSFSATGPGDFTTKHTDTASSGYNAGKHGPAPMQIVVTSGIGTNPVALNFYMNTLTGTVTKLVTLTAPQAGTVGTTKAIGDNTVDFFLKVNTVQIAGGTSGLQLQVNSVLERTVQQ